MKTLNLNCGLLTVLLTLTSTGPAIAQTNQDPVPGATEEIHQHERQGRWTDHYRVLCEWDAKGDWTEMIWQDRVGDAWKSKRRNLRIYDDTGKLTEEFNAQGWTGTEWEYPIGEVDPRGGGSPRVVHSYDDSGSVISSTHYLWNGSEWDLFWRVTSTFDQVGRATVDVHEGRHHGSLGLDLYAYDDAENRVETTRRNWIGSRWEESWREVEISDDSGKLLDKYMETWSGSDWEKGQRTTYMYDESGNVIEETWQLGGEDWENHIRYVLSYDDEGNLLEHVDQRWLGAWRNSSRDRMVLDASGRRMEKISEIWRGAGWDPYWRVLYSYETSTGIEEEALDLSERPDFFRLDQNYPNPFNPATTITYDLPQSAEVRLTVHDALGRTIATLDAGRQAADRHGVTWDATNLPSGIYFYRLEAGDFAQTKPMILAK
jgi:YD repeat-containing protein